MKLSELKELAEKANQTESAHLNYQQFRIEVNPHTILQLIERVEKLSEALEFYTGKIALRMPDDWSYFKEGGAPDIDQLEKEDLGQVAHEALSLYGPDKELG